MGFSKFRNQANIHGKPGTETYYYAFLAEWEGVEGFSGSGDEEIGQFLEKWEPEECFGDSNDYRSCDNYMTEFGHIDPYETIEHLKNQSTLHAVSKKDIFKGNGKLDYFKIF